jgi:hypothetical protein
MTGEELKSTITVLESAREAIRGVVALANINDGTRQILIGVGNGLNKEVSRLSTFVNQLPCKTVKTASSE